MTGILSLEEQISKGVGILREGGVIAFPTDTIYGLGASVDKIEAVRRIFRIKQRPAGMGLPVLVADKEQLLRVVAEFPPLAACLAERFWPGALTLVLPKAKDLSPVITGCADTVAVRMPAHPVTLALLRGLGVPIIGTSANKSGQPNPTNAEEVRAQLGDEVDMIIDAGKTAGDVASTIVVVSGDRIKVLRLGVISAEDIEKVVTPKIP